MKKFHHAEMTYVIERELELEDKLQKLSREFSTWKERVELARRAGRDELAEQAAQRVDSMRSEAREIRRELKLIVAKKQLIRMESRRPTGNEVRRAEALLESFRQSGLIDPDEAQLQSEFDQLAASPQAQEASAPLSVAADGADAPDTDAPDTDASTAASPSIEELTLEDIENLDPDVLERLLAAEDY